jgi:hypothetical protein
LHVNAHTPPLQSAVAFATAGHLLLQPPQSFGDVLGSTHSAPQATGAMGVQPFVHWKEGPAGAHNGAAAAHAALHAPQVPAFERSTSQPSVLFALQSA